MGRYPADKYRLRFRELAEGVRQLASSPVLELNRLLELLAFSYLIGNGDLHARNVSLLVDTDGRVLLSPAYDLLSTLPYGDRRMALKVMGRDDNLKRAHLLEMARVLGLRAAAVTEMLDRVCERIAETIDRVGEIGLGAKKTADLQRLMRKRRAELA